MSAAIESKKLAITSADVLVRTPGIDVIIDATGKHGVAADLDLMAMEHGKHLVMMNVEADVTIGPYLKKEADRLGVVYSVGAGDEPSSCMELIEFATTLGYRIVSAGKGKNNPLNHDAVPDDFTFAVKGSRFITHNLKLRHAEQALANFYASGVLALGHKTGPFLWQLPATYRYDRERVAGFLARLPADSSDGARLARRHDDRVTHALLANAEPVRYRHALEARHPSYFTDDVLALLASFDCALVIADTAGTFPYREAITADFVYVRLHGSRALYASGYTDDELAAWADRVVAWAGGGTRDVYVYFDNDAQGYAPWNARSLQGAIDQRLLGAC